MQILMKRSTMANKILMSVEWIFEAEIYKW